MTDQDRVERLIEECRQEWLFDHMKSIETDMGGPATEGLYHLDDSRFRLEAGWESVWSDEAGAYVWRKKF